MAALIVSLFSPVVRTSRAAQADQIVKNFLFTSQQFFGLCPRRADCKEISLCLRTKLAYQVPSVNLDSEWIDPVRFRVSGESSVIPSEIDACLVIANASIKGSVTHG